MHSWAVASAVVAPVAPVAAWALAQSRQPPGYDPVRQTISVLSERGATDRWVMTAGLAVLGICYLVTAAGLVEAAPGGRLLLAVGGAGTVGTAIWAQPAPGHVIAASIAFLALASWPLFALVPARSTGVLVSSIFSILLIWFAVEVRGGDLLGLSERVLAAAEALWPLVVVLLLWAGRTTARYPQPRQQIAQHQDSQHQDAQLSNTQREDAQLWNVQLSNTQREDAQQ